MHSREVGAKVLYFDVAIQPEVKLKAMPARSLRREDIAVVLVNSCCGACSIVILVGNVVDNVTELFHE